MQSPPNISLTLFACALAACSGKSHMQPQPRIAVHESFVTQDDHLAIVEALPRVLDCIRVHRSGTKCGLSPDADGTLAHNADLFGVDGVYAIEYQNHDPESNTIEVAMESIAGFAGSNGVLYFVRDGAGWRADQAATLIAD